MGVVAGLFATCFERRCVLYPPISLVELFIKFVLVGDGAALTRVGPVHCVGGAFLRNR